uniref:Uncharacterized protein n=1 Tax=Arundo donax TaxID=35708 RepID=A0A0A8ZS81_ARUDO
MRGFSHTLRSI